MASNALEIRNRTSRGYARSVMLYGGDALVRAGLRSLIHERTELQVTDVDDNADLAETASRLQPDVVILDLTSSRPDDSRLVCLLRAAAPAARVLALAPSRDEQWKRDAILLGAHRLVTKQESADAFLDAIEAVEGPTEPTASTASAPRADAPERLSNRELQVARLVCKGLRNETIGRMLFISEATVRHHLTAIFAKRRVVSRAELIVDAYRNAFLA